jgi:hypothetical protein
MEKTRKPGTFKPGVSGNPTGKPKLPQDVRDAQRLTTIEFTRIVNKYLSMTKDELKAMASHPDTKVLSLMIASLVSKAVLEGDDRRMGFLLDRIIGKVPQPIVAQIDPQLLELVKEMQDKPQKELLEIFEQERIKSLS